MQVMRANELWMMAGSSDLLIDREAVVNAGGQYKKISCLHPNSNLKEMEVREVQQRR